MKNLCTEKFCSRKCANDTESKMEQEYLLSGYASRGEICLEQLFIATFHREWSSTKMDFEDCSRIYRQVSLRGFR
jgi:hypothetical protein